MTQPYFQMGPQIQSFRGQLNMFACGNQQGPVSIEVCRCRDKTFSMKLIAAAHLQKKCTTITPLSPRITTDLHNERIRDTRATRNRKYCMLLRGTESNLSQMQMPPFRFNLLWKRWKGKEGDRDAGRLGMRDRGDGVFGGRGMQRKKGWVEGEIDEGTGEKRREAGCWPSVQW